MNGLDLYPSLALVHPYYKTHVSHAHSSMGFICPVFEISVSEISASTPMQWRWMEQLSVFPEIKKVAVTLIHRPHRCTDCVWECVFVCGSAAQKNSPGTPCLSVNFQHHVQYYFLSLFFIANITVQNHVHYCAAVERKVPDTPGQHWEAQEELLSSGHWDPKWEHCLRIALRLFLMTLLFKVTYCSWYYYLLLIWFFTLILFYIYFYCTTEGANSHTFHYHYTLYDFMWQINLNCNWQHRQRQAIRRDKRDRSRLQQRWSMTPRRDHQKACLQWKKPWVKLPPTDASLKMIGH